MNEATTLPAPATPARPSFASIYMGLALALARRSTCARLQVGCVITSTDWRKVFGVGYNGGATGQENACESLEPGLCGHIHAELNAIVNCDAPHGTPKIVLCTNMPCPMCCKLIVNMRDVVRVIFANEYRAPEGAATLRRAGIELFLFDRETERLLEIVAPRPIHGASEPSP